MHTPSPNIDCLVDGVVGHRMLSFLDAYSGNSQIRMDPTNEDIIAFIIESKKYCYKVMSFKLKNVRATYQWQIDKVFGTQLGGNLEVCVDDMVSKSDDLSAHIKDLEEVFKQL